jgi:asparagine synthase (glutamine-hydrolysing)
VAAFDRWAPPGSRRLAALVWPWLPYGLRGKNFLRRVSLNAHDRYLDEIGHFQPDEKDALLSPDVRRRLGGAKANEAVAPRFERFNKLPWHGQLMGFDFETYLPGDILTKVDRTSMAHSIESRVPLLDNEVIDFAARLPVDLKIREGRRKYILKRAATGLLPESVLHRRKKGFGVPVGMWFRGGLRELFVDVLLSQRARQRGYFNVGFIQRLVGEHLDGTRDHTWRLWALLIFELWHRQYLDSRSAQRQLVA